MIPLVVAALLGASAPAQPPVSASPRTFEMRGFGAVHVHAPEDHPRRVVVLLSGEGPGVREGRRALAEALAARGALVLAVDTAGYLARHREHRCVYPAGDLEALAQHLEKELGLEEYVRPYVVGHSQGAAATWAALAQAPEGTFAGAVALAPCPGKPLGVPLCAGAGPAPRSTPQGDLPADGARPSAPLAIVAGAKDRACPAASAQAFGRGRALAVTVLPGVGHALVPVSSWAAAAGDEIDRIEAQCDAAEAAPSRPAAGTPAAPPRAEAQAAGGDRPPDPAPPAAAAPPPDVKNLPLVEVPAAKPGPRLAVLLTGDGGWVGLDKGMSRALSDVGVSVVGLDSLRYFWRRRTPDETAKDVARIFAHYGAAWGRRELVLIGYSRGADIVPFVATRLPADQRAALKLVAMLGPQTFAEFEVHMVDLFSSVRRSAATSTEAAVRASGGATRFLCVQGADESDSLCPHLVDLPWVARVVLPGGHHFDRDYANLARIVNDAASGTAPGAGAPSSP
ncbi:MULTISPECIES: AcvB/VirJ family lysyl-phosphatidylglycerol hydrolase [Anaeromyxobacter]|uniref:AcvB/VirJ family lysyl-phosphatidylglycerol hydrolase n=1 Tax=Anaeromyxobacter TaxID=161492 RepID=UPI001F564612|nr:MULTISPECIES: AcvB/VirJ family lysyl-phosphatidylglycerol hydrolase [unclassified Anaeromyxobacter]